MRVMAFLMLLSVFLMAGCSSQSSICKEFGREQIAKGIVVLGVTISKTEKTEDCAVLVDYDDGNGMKTTQEIKGNYKKYGDRYVWAVTETHYIGSENIEYPDSARGLKKMVTAFAEVDRYAESCDKYLKSVIDLKDNYFSSSWEFCKVPPALAGAIMTYFDAQPVNPKKAADVCSELTDHTLKESFGYLVNGNRYESLSDKYHFLNKDLSHDEKENYKYMEMVYQYHDEPGVMRESTREINYYLSGMNIDNLFLVGGNDDESCNMQFSYEVTTGPIKKEHSPFFGLDVSHIEGERFSKAKQKTGFVTFSFRTLPDGAVIRTSELVFKKGENVGAAYAVPVPKFL